FLIRSFKKAGLCSSARDCSSCLFWSSSIFNCSSRCFICLPSSKIWFFCHTYPTPEPPMNRQSKNALNAGPNLIAADLYFRFFAMLLLTTDYWVPRSASRFTLYALQLLNRAQLRASTSWVFRQFDRAGFHCFARHNLHFGRLRLPQFRH